MKVSTKLWLGLAGLILLSPLGLILPAKFGAGSAWGEWSAGEIKHLVGYLPDGMAKTVNYWSAPMPDYGFKGQQAPSGLTYILSAVVGVGAVVILTLLIGKALAKREHTDAS